MRLSAVSYTDSLKNLILSSSHTTVSKMCSQVKAAAPRWSRGQQIQKGSAALVEYQV